MGMFLEFKKKSGKRDSDPRPQPWQGCALPTELFPHGVFRNCECKGKQKIRNSKFFLRVLRIFYCETGLNALI